MVDLPETRVIIEDLGIGQNGKAHAFFTNTCALHMDKYVPMDTGALATTVVVNGVATSNVNENSITYAQPYASYVYYGITKNGNKMNYHKDKHKFATYYWDEKMASAEMDTIVKEVQHFMDRST